MGKSVFLRDRNGFPVSPPFGAAFIPLRYSWHVFGGPKQATVQVLGDSAALLSLATFLGYSITLADELGNDVWWGMVDSVVIHTRRQMLSVGLADMYNSIYVQYNDETTSGMSNVQTHTLSVDTYGTKELIDSGADLDAVAVADAMALQMVNFYGLPRVERAPDASDTDYAEITAIGWFDTLSWAYYADTDTSSIATSTQIATIVTNEGQFLNGTVINTASGINLSAYQDGQARAIDIIIRYLELGVGSGNRYTAKVDKGLYLQLNQEPSLGAKDYRYDSKGRLLDNYGYPVLPQLCPVGMWVKDTFAGLSTIQSRIISDPGAFFVESSEYDCQTGALTLTPRGAVQGVQLLKKVTKG